MNEMKKGLQEVKVLKQVELLGQQFKVYGTLDEPLFKAKDVTEMLGLTNSREVMSRIDEDERCKLNLPRQGSTWMLTENGLYEVLMQSRKPIAKEFKKGVKAILKEIRTNGGYMVSRVDDTPELIMARALVVARAWQKYSSKIWWIQKLVVSLQRSKMVVIYFAGQAVKLLTLKVGFFVAQLEDIGGCLLRKIIKALGVETILEQRNMAAAFSYAYNHQ